MLKRYIIERTVPNISHWTEDELKTAVEHSRAVLSNLGPDIHWIHSYFTDDKLFCVYEAANEEIIRKHASIGGFPADSVYEIKGDLSPDFGKEIKRPYTIGNSTVDLNFS